jgi:rhodanese-related sulfurtransferase
MEQYLEFTANHPLLIGALLLSFFLVVFSELKRRARGVVSLEPQDAVKLINADAVVIDLRSPEAFAKGHIVNARNIPADELGEKSAVLEKFRSRPIVTVCDAGMTSSRTVDKLRKSGLENVFGLRGGIATWQQASLPLVTSQKTKKKK